MNTPSPKLSAARSKLVVIGIVLMFAGSGSSHLASHVAALHSHLRFAIGVGGDCLVLAGAVCGFIGWLRIRRKEISRQS